jgi:hypothetical protein
MIQKAIDRLEYLCETIPALLKDIDDKSFSEKPLPDKWSKKEIIGHLIDSATNNHHRFIRCQFEYKPTIWYDQNNWNMYGHYQLMDKLQLIKFWTSYNIHLVEIIKLIPIEKLKRICVMKDGSELTLDFLINDYVAHLEHHLKQVISYQ